MKQFLLKNIEEAPKLNYKKSLDAIIKSPLNPQIGIRVEEMRKSVRILDLLEKVQDNEMWQLEDADHAFLKEKVEAFHYGESNKRLLEFIDDVLKAEDAPKNS